MWYGCMSGVCGSGIGVSGVCESNLCSSLWYKKILSLTFSAFRCLLFNKNPYFIKSVWNIHFEEHRINTAGQKQWNVQAKIKVFWNSNVFTSFSLLLNITIKEVKTLIQISFYTRCLTITGVENKWSSSGCDQWKVFIAVPNHLCQMAVPRQVLKLPKSLCNHSSKALGWEWHYESHSLVY